MHNHLGQLGEGNHAIAKSLFLGGVTRRFPDLGFAFLEGGVGWAVMLLSDLVGHWEKRNVAALAHLDPSSIDVGLLGDLTAKYGARLTEIRVRRRARRGAGSTTAMRGTEDPEMLDEWAACRIRTVDDIRDLYVPPFFFGCEADDPITATAFDPKLNPFGARLQAMFGSDVAHWDVPDMSEVLEEAWEMVDHGLIDEQAFRDFTFTNPVRFHRVRTPGSSPGPRSRERSRSCSRTADEHGLVGFPRHGTSPAREHRRAGTGRGGPGGGGGDAGRASTSTLLEPGVSRVLVISTPGVGWSVINEVDTPNLWQLLGDRPRATSPPAPSGAPTWHRAISPWARGHGRRRPGRHSTARAWSRSSASAT